MYSIPNPSEPSIRFGGFFKYLRWGAASLLALCAMAASAEVVITNTPNGTLGGTTITDVEIKALMFTTGGVPATVNKISLGLNPAGSNFAPVPVQAKVEIALYSVAAGIPSVQLATTGLLDVNILQRQQIYDFNISPVFNLQASTPYALVVRSDSAGIKWSNTGSPVTGTEPTALGGFVYVRFLGKDLVNTDWYETPSKLNTVEINATLIPPVPSLAAWTMALLASCMAFVAWRTQRKRAHPRKL